MPESKRREEERRAHLPTLGPILLEIRLISSVSTDLPKVWPVVDVRYRPDELHVQLPATVAVRHDDDAVARPDVAEEERTIAGVPARMCEGEPIA
jgi:hypothetical protein